MAPNPHHVLALAAKIAEAEKTLASLNEEWESMFSNAGVSQPAVRTSRAKRDNSFPSRVEKVITESPQKTFTIAEVAEALGEESLKVGRALFRLSQSGRIDNPDRGKYRSKRFIEFTPVAA